MKKKLTLLSFCMVCPLCFWMGGSVYAAPNPEEEDLLGGFIAKHQLGSPQNESADGPAEGMEKADLGEFIRKNVKKDDEGRVPAGSGKPISKKDADDVIAGAMGFLGVAYRFGGTTPSGFDCSGFMQYVFKRTLAINLPRTSAEQATVGAAVERADLQPGDLVFFRTQGKRISHVGMYVGNNRFIHSPRTGKSIEISSLSQTYWDSRYAMARRVKRHDAKSFVKK